MITKFKIFESYSIANDLIDDVDDNEIIEYFDNNYKMDFNEVLSMSTASDLLNVFDDLKYVQDTIYDTSNSNSYENYDEDDYKKYINKNLTEDTKNKIIELYNDNNYDEDNEDSEKTIKFDKYLIDDLDKYQLREVIEEDSNEADFVNYMVKDRYESMSAEEIIDEIYGDPREMEVNELYEIIKNYIDEDKFVEKWIKDEDFDFKKHFVIDNIYRSKKLQRNIFDNNPDRLLDLVELFDETKKWKGNENIGNEYDFQLKYIEKIIEKQKEEDQEYEDEPIEFDEKYESKLKASALEYLYDNFGLDPEIKTEFKKYLWRVIPKKGYNL